jgi:Collagen triple helix repeat (20 copies)
MGDLYFRDSVSGDWTLLPVMGAPGDVGPTGDTGPTGQQGEAGLIGFSGLSGIPGAPGVKGPQGAQGPRGPQGAVGPRGAQGARGSQGPVGPQGVAGAKGPQGAQGPRGTDHGVQFRIGKISMETVTADSNFQGPWTTFSSPYVSPPQLVTAMRTGVPGGIYVSVTHTGLNNAGFYPVVYRTNTTTCLVDWIAVRTRGTLREEGQVAYPDGNIWFVQLAELAGGHAAYEAKWIDTDEVTGGLTLFDAAGTVVQSFELGEWISVQHEYVVGGQII